MSWVGRDELASIVAFVLRTETLSGPVNSVSPNPVRNAEFATISAETLQQKRGSTMPAFLVRALMGEMGEEFILASRCIQPAKLLAAGYQFQFPRLEDALLHEKECLNTGSPSTVVDKHPAVRI
jgi:NAD dependent epimerase/dehydratase family enzyme